MLLLGGTSASGSFNQHTSKLMFARKTNMKKVSTSAVITAMIMLVGILFIAYGHSQNSSSVLFVGVLITLAGVLSGIVRIVVQGKA